MIAAAIIVLREVFEAALLIGIVLAATRAVPRGAWVAGGIALGIVGSLVVAGFAERIASALEGFGQEMFNAGVLLAATAMLGWHNVWMKRHGADLARQMSAVGHDVSGGAAPLSVLLVVVGLAVLREGSEIVLFLYGIAAGGADAAQPWAGSAPRPCGRRRDRLGTLSRPGRHPAALPLYRHELAAAAAGGRHGGAGRRLPRAGGQAAGAG